jgi:hypothetical protein
VWIVLGFSLFLSWWPLPFGQEWWDHIQYEVLGSSVICRWREQSHIQICCVVTGGPQYLGYRTPIDLQCS